MTKTVAMKAVIGKTSEINIGRPSEVSFMKTDRFCPSPISVSSRMTALLIQKTKTRIRENSPNNTRCC